MAKKDNKNYDFAQFTNKDGYTEGGVEIETPKAGEIMEADVHGQGNILAEKKRKAKWI